MYRIQCVLNFLFVLGSYPHPEVTERLGRIRIRSKSFRVPQHCLVWTQLDDSVVLITNEHKVTLSLLIKSGDLDSSVADPGCLSRKPDPNFSIPDPGSGVKKIPNPEFLIRIKEFKYY